MGARWCRGRIASRGKGVGWVEDLMLKLLVVRRKVGRRVAARRGSWDHWVEIVRTVVV